MTEKKTSQEILPVQKWLEENCKPDDWDRLEEGLKDGLWTNNVLDYMKDYADYVSEQRVKELEAENEWISVDNPPPPDTRVLVELKYPLGTKVITSHYVERLECFDHPSHKLIVRWRYLPQPPKHQE